MSATIIQMGTFESHDKAAVRREAIAWMVRLTSGSATEEERRQCAAWRAQSPEHDAAFRRCEKTWNRVGHMARPAGLQETETMQENHRVATRRRIAWAIAASVLLAVALWNVQAVNRLQRLMTDHRTAVGEQRLVTLKDESTILLNTDSAVDVGYSSTVREIRLLRGEAAVTMAHDPARPFSVIMPDLTATALGTQFVVKTVSGRSTVTVLEHAVRVVPNRSPPTAPSPSRPDNEPGSCKTNSSSWTPSIWSRRLPGGTASSSSTASRSNN